MPLVRITVPQTLGADDVRYIADAVHEALTTAFSVPVQDRFQVISRHGADELICTSEYLGVRHTERTVLVQITVSEGRSVETKRALYARLARNVAAGAAVSAADVIISLLEVKKENWSFGDGVAHYAT
jgi:phenylpyruvate tautomerase PptA (4-oxalocrotonate tautomerase family)